MIIFTIIVIIVIIITTTIIIIAIRPPPLSRVCVDAPITGFVAPQGAQLTAPVAAPAYRPPPRDGTPLTLTVAP
eukprot:5284119-Pyramimonas_sp.AAC.1